MTSAAAVVDSAYAFTAASYAIIVTRTLLRRFKHESFLPDDYLMFFSMIFAALNTACYPISVNTSPGKARVKGTQVNRWADLLRNHSYGARRPRKVDSRADPT